MARRRMGAPAERYAQQQTQNATGRSIPAPVSGWNARDPIAAMKPGDAYQLDNWICRPGYVEIRRGFLGHVTGFEEPIETLLPYRAGNNEKMFAASAGSIYDVSDPSDGLPAASYTGLTSNRIQTANFANDAGIFMIGVNGADTPFKYNGSAFSTTVITGTSGSITLDPVDLIDVMVHKRRLFFIEKNGLRVWFLDADAIAGAAGLLDLGPVFTEGGELVAMGVWSPEGPTNAIQALAVFITDQGQVAVYAGDDPSDADNWRLVGVYAIARPLGRRAILRTASDLIVMTYDGAVPLSVISAAKREDQRDLAITSRIQNAFAVASNAYAENFGWEAQIYPSGQLAIINVPVTELGTSRQFVQSTQTGKWSQFIGLDAVTWCYVNNTMYFAGTDGSGAIGVWQWDTGGSDNGTAIQCDAITAFEDYGTPGRQKQFTLLRPILRAATSLRPFIDVLVDYQVVAPSNIPDGGEAVGSGEWGEGAWGVARWTSTQPVRLDWTSATGIGYVGAVRIRVVSNPSRSDADAAHWDEAFFDVGVWGPDNPAYPTVRCEWIGTDLQYLTGASL